VQIRLFDSFVACIGADDPGSGRRPR
jgi:hypothetical protein